MGSLARYILENFSEQLNAVLKIVRKYEATLGPDDDWVEDDRRLLFEAAEKYLKPITGHTFVYDIGDTDYIGSVDLSPDAFEQYLYEKGYRRNLISARKRRDTEGGKQYAYSSWALYVNDGGHQHHVWFFEAEDGGVDMYAHFEDNATDSQAHLHIDDDEDDIVGMERAEPYTLFEMLDESNISYEPRD